MARIPGHGARFNLNIDPDDPDSVGPVLFRAGTPHLLMYRGARPRTMVRWDTNGVFLDGKISLNEKNKLNKPPVGKVYSTGDVILATLEDGKQKDIVAPMNCYLESTSLEGDTINPEDAIAQLVPIADESVLLRISRDMASFRGDVEKSGKAVGWIKGSKITDRPAHNGRAWAIFFALVSISLLASNVLTFYGLYWYGICVVLITVFLAYRFLSKAMIF